MSNSGPVPAPEPEDDAAPARAPNQRRAARELALSVLYEADAVGHPAGAVLAQRLEDEAPAPGAAKRARELVTGVLAHRAPIDAKIAAAAPNWPLAQMPAVEKAILRVALFEILFDNRPVPLKAAISEAVELAKRYGSDSSPRFVNGVLSTIARSALAEADGARAADEAEPSA